MRVLEVGPGRFPVEKYLGDLDVDYVSTELGVWDNDIERHFNLVAARLRPGDTDQRFFPVPVSSLDDSGFDIAIASNVYGDPGSIPRDSKGELLYTGGAETIMAKALAKRLVAGGKLEILETYTPINKDLLIEILGSVGFTLDQFVSYGKELGLILEEYYMRQGATMMLRMVPEVRINAARSHDLPLEEPFFARFVKG